MAEHFTPVALLGSGTETNVTNLFLHEVPMDEQKEHATILVAKCTTIQAETDSLVVIVTSKCGLLTTEGIQTPKPTKPTLRA